MGVSLKLRKIFLFIIALLFFTFAYLMFFGDRVFAFLNLENGNNLNQKTDSFKQVLPEQEHRGIWFSYLDWMNLIKNSLNNGKVERIKYTQNVEKICSNLKSIGINNLYLCVRAFGDAFYPSSVAYKSKFLQNLNFDEFDPLKLYLEIAKTYGLKIHGWINPMRVFKKDDADNIPENFLIKRWLNDNIRKNYYLGLNNNECWVLNPCNPEVVDHLTAVLDELLERYDFDGIHFDDYFYPSDIKNTNYDIEYFNKIKPNCDIETFRFNGVSNLVKKFYDKCHETKKNGKSIVFGIAIIGNAGVNRSMFVDFRNWIKNGYVDYLMPEIYYGFTNKYMSFNKCVDEWNSILNELKDSSVNLNFFVGMAAYKLGQQQQKEIDPCWLQVGNILSAQEQFCRNNFPNYGGYCLFDYKSIFDEKGEIKSMVSSEIENLNKLF